MTQKCLDCKAPITSKAKRCQKCAQIVTSVRREKKRQKRVERAPSDRQMKLEKVERELEEARRLYSIVTGRQMSRYWFGRITVLEAQALDLQPKRRK